MPTKILAIDDSKTIRYAIKITFAAEDADVTTVSKGSEAVARAQQLGADVVLIDAKLANGEPSGYEVCEALKKEGDTSGIPVILMVSNQEGVDQSQLQAVGADGWIAKPFDTQELIDKVAEAVGKPVAKPSGAARPAAAAKPAPAPKPTPAPRPTPSVQPIATPAAAAPVPGVKPKPAPRPRPTPDIKPAPAPSPARSAAPSRHSPSPAPQPAAPTQGGDIPIAVPIPFTPAGSPTPGILQRIQEAGGGGAVDGLDPKVVQALVSLSREVIEQVVWEVVPDLAEEIIKKQAKSA